MERTDGTFPLRSSHDRSHSSGWISPGVLGSCGRRWVREGAVVVHVGVTSISIFRSPKIRETIDCGGEALGGDVAFDDVEPIAPQVSVLDRIHGAHVHTRRADVLSRALAELIPRNARVLDVGSGDGLLGSLIAKRRPDVAITGIDTLLRDRPQIPTGVFDGKVIPYPDASFDVAILVDVLHHTEDPTALLGEADRVSRQAILVKDHTLEGRLGGPTLRIMDWVGNARHGVSLPYNYWTEAKWLAGC